MQINLIVVGKIKEKFIRDAIDEYKKRLSVFSKLKIIEVADEKVPENLSQKELEYAIEKEGKKILEKIKDDSFLVSLEINAKEKSSLEFANFIKDEMQNGFGRDLNFVIGGSNGLSDEVSKRANLKLSFSKMTFPHQLMRLILIEQIYRAFMIINNKPYHK